LQVEHSKPNEHLMIISIATSTTRLTRKPLPFTPALFALAILLALPLGLRAGAPEGLNGATTESTPSSQPIPWSDLGAKATAQYSGDGLAVYAGENGAVRLHCVFQRLEGEVTRAGLWLTSTVEGAAADRFRVVADYVGRDGGAMVALPERGVAGGEPGLARYIRCGLVEEYSVSVDGVRQDFVVTEPPGGAGPLRVDMAVNGARAEAAANGARLVLDSSGRKLAYSRLRVVDARCRELAAHLEVASATRLAVVVDDAAATYPVQIDPTFSNENWVSLGGFPATDGTVYAAVVDASGNLYIGGDFTEAGGMAAKYIAKWNGSAWSALGSGMNNVVRALAVSGTDLYAGGDFTTAGGKSANYIAKWNGSAWSALGSGIGGLFCYVLALAVSGTDLYVGGNFTTAGGSAAKYIAKWNGSAWSALGSGMKSYVNALAVSGGNLYAGGGFTEAGGTSANNIAKWNPATGWSALGSGVNSYVYALAVSGTDLYAGGWFTTAGGTEANYIAKWDGSAWSALGSGMGGIYHSVDALAVSGTDLYAGGEFDTAGGTEAYYIAKWDGSAWSALGSGMDDYVAALAVSGTDLYAGGRFTMAGDKGSGSVAKAVLALGPAAGLAKTITVSNSTPTIVFQGTPGSPYDVQRTPNLNEPVVWTILTSATPLIPGADGLCSFADTNAPSGTAYYRSRPR
jgi:hypothetical protein